jgi:hypothetical protein
MDVQITDSAALRRVSPAALSAYLETQGWVRQETWRNRTVLWSHTHNEQVNELLTPLREQSDAYAVRISEVVALLGQLEERSQLDVYYDLMGAGADVIRLRSLNGGGRSGWSLSDSADLLGRARDLITAAARAAERPGQPVYHGRASGVVTDYVREVRPLPGYGTGYELTLHSQVPADYGIQRDFGNSFKPPFARQSTLALNNGLRQAGNTAEAVLGGAGISSFDEVAQQGVSANLCEAVAALARQGHGIEVSVSWAPVRPSDASDGQFTFAESTADVFADGAEWLRRKSPLLNAQVAGEIVRLDRESQEEFDGQAVMLCELDGRPVALQVQFDTADRQEVVRAFRDSLEISVDGDIYREGRRYYLRGPHNFSVVD